jgi:hypothetical protein
VAAGCGPTEYPRNAQASWVSSKTPKIFYAMNNTSNSKNKRKSGAEMDDYNPRDIIAVFRAWIGNNGRKRASIADFAHYRRQHNQPLTMAEMRALQGIKADAERVRIVYQYDNLGRLQRMYERLA